MKIYISAAVDLNSYILKTDYINLVEKIIAHQNENVALKLHIDIFKDCMNSLLNNND